MNIPTLLKNSPLNKKFSVLSHSKTALKSIALGSLVAFSANAASPIRALVTDGSVSITDNESGRRLPLKTGQTLEEGVTISTGRSGSCVLVFSNGSAVRMDSNSSLNIEDYEHPNNQTASTELTLEKGEVISHVKRTASSNYKITTQAGEVKVTGTTFSVDYDAASDTTSVTTSEGSVQLSFAGNVLSIPAGYSANSASGDLSELLADKGLDGYAFQQALEAATQAGVAAKSSALGAGLSGDEASQFGNTAAATAFAAAWNASQSLANPTEASINLASSEAAQNVISVFNEIIASGQSSPAATIASGEAVLAQVLAGVDVESANIAQGSTFRSTKIDTHETNRRQLPVQISPL